MATTTAESGPPFPLAGLTSAPWREQALTKIGEQRFLLSWMLQQPGTTPVGDDALQTIRDHWDAAAAAAKEFSRRGASVERVTGHLDAVDTDLLRMAPPTYVYGQLPGLLGQMRKSLPADDIRLQRVEALVTAPGPIDLTPTDRDLIVAACHGVSLEARREVTRLRSFKRMLYGTAVVLMLGAIGMAAFGLLAPDKLPICFDPGSAIVCATSTSAIPGAGAAAPGQASNAPPAVVDRAMRDGASGWDIPLVELVGLLAAALAGAASLRKIRGSSTPFGLPVALALLKLPTGALTAVFGLLLMRGEFVPGLTALDSSGQIIAWAILLGYSQQLLTRFVDQRAQTVLDNFSRTPAERQQAEAVVGTGALPAR
jgi:hypothetical protein